MKNITVWQIGTWTCPDCGEDNKCDAFPKEKTAVCDCCKKRFRIADVCTEA